MCHREREEERERERNRERSGEQMWDQSELARMELRREGRAAEHPARSHSTPRVKEPSHTHTLSYTQDPPTHTYTHTLTWLLFHIKAQKTKKSSTFRL